MFRKKIGILICILVAFVLASASIADSPWTDFYAYLLGEEILDALYFKGVWRAEGHVEGGDITFNVGGREIEAKFDFYVTAIYISDRDPNTLPEHPEDAIIDGSLAIYDEEGAFYGAFHGKGFSGKFHCPKAEGKWEGQKIQGEFTTNPNPPPGFYEGELNGQWKNFDN